MEPFQLSESAYKTLPESMKHLAVRVVRKAQPAAPISATSDNETEIVTGLWDAIKGHATIAVIDQKMYLFRLCIQADTVAAMEAGIRGTGGVWPDWVYECRQAIKFRDENIPWLTALTDALGWQGGTIHDALSCVRRLVAAEKEREH